MKSFRTRNGVSIKANNRGRVCQGEHGCYQFKRWSAFNRCSNGYNGRRNICRDCMGKQRRQTFGRLPEAEKQRRRDLAGQNYRRHKHKYKAGEKRSHRATVLRNHGIDEEIFKRMMREQEGLCAICRRPSTRTDKRIRGPVRLCIDHNHLTGKVRGLLCSSCNTVLGLARENPIVLKAAIAYLKRHYEPIL